LHNFDNWLSPKQFYERMPGYTRTSLALALRELTESTLLVRQGSREAKDDANLEKVWSRWQPHAAALHFATKDAPYLRSSAKIAAMIRGFLRESPQPPFFKRYPTKAEWKLPGPQLNNSDFIRVLLARRTHRAFSSDPLPFESLAQLLFYTWGVTGYLRIPVLGQLPLKTSPSAGARHPIEVYVLALRVEGLPRGLYHYAPDHHCLEKLGSSGSPEIAAEYCADQAWIGKAAALFIMTAVFPRSMWKYRFARAYRTVLLDAGHLCQTFCLVATQLGLAPFCTAALRDSRIEKDLGVDGTAESVIYVAGAGVAGKTAKRRRDGSVAPRHIKVQHPPETGELGKL
jgi:SagB-type dehydrogenase family enzyme